MSNTIHQKVSYELYKQELDSIYTKSKYIKNSLLRKAKIYTILSILIGYPTKIALGISVGSGTIQLVTTQDGMQSATAMFISQNNYYWITILRIVFEILALVLTITRDFFQFESQIEKYYSASQAIESFCTSVKYQTFLQKENEGDRYEILLMFKKLYEEMSTSHSIIQTVELTSPATPPDEHHRAVSQGMDSATSSADEENQLDEPRRSSLTEDKKRLFYIHSQLERIPH